MVTEMRHFDKFVLTRKLAGGREGGIWEGSSEIASITHDVQSLLNKKHR